MSHIAHVSYLPTQQRSFLRHVHAEWCEELILMLTCGLTCCQDIFKTRTTKLDKNWMCQRSYSMTMSSRASRGLWGICIALQNCNNIGKSFQRRMPKCGRHASAKSSKCQWNRCACCCQTNGQRQTPNELWAGLRDSICSHDCAAHSEKTPGHEKNGFTMDSRSFDENSKMATYRKNDTMQLEPT